MVIFNVRGNFLLSIKTLVADIAHKKGFTINNFNLEIVFYIQNFDFFAFHIIYTVFMNPCFNLIITMFISFSIKSFSSFFSLLHSNLNASAAAS